MRSDIPVARLRAVAADGLDRAAFLGLLAQAFLVIIFGLLEEIAVAAIVVAFEIRGRRLAAQIAVDALIVHVVFPRDVFFVLVGDVGHGRLFGAAKVGTNPSAAKTFSAVDPSRRARDVSSPMTDQLSATVAPAEGWHVLHIFYKIEHGAWALLSLEEQLAAKTHLTELVQEIRATPTTQLLVFSIVSPKADLGFMLLTPDLHTANAAEKRLSLGLGPDVLLPAYSFLSLTESSEYTSTNEELAANLAAEDQMQPGSREFEGEMEKIRTRMAKYKKDKLYPVLPVWEVFCFYPMNKRRGAGGQNWFALPFEERKKLMAGHARVGRKYHGKILQLITGATGLDDWEWGVTLFAHDTFDLKAIVYEMRFDPVSAHYAEFGEFFIGLSVPLDELFRRLQL